ncbi:MAG: isoprenylcysteine carboxylmethyltransferase family protein [Chlorobi bacterium]|nr:isoprenylcysteine carboxylmethyltransferase family protein [Chlorobiota bacterium]
MNLIFTITYGIWFLSEIIINRLLRSKETDKPNVDKGSIYLIWVIIFVSIFTAVFVTNKYYVPLLKNSNIEYFGLLLIYTGIIFRLLIIRSLGHFFTVDVTIKQNHKIKKDGFYKHLRHPSYSASLLSFIGFGITLNNLISLTLVFILILTAFIIRIKIEERILIEHFGSEYLDYKNNTKGIIPFIY